MTKYSRNSVSLVAICMLALLGAAFSPQKGKHKPAAKGVTALRSAARADSIARSRADSLQAAVRARAVADSLQRSDSLAVRQRKDSLAAPPMRHIPNEAFGVGERLVFDVNFGFITAGEAVMTIPSYDSIASRKCYRIQFTVNSLPSFSWIYKVEDRYLTFIDVQAIAPLRFEQHIHEGSFTRDFVAEFDHQKRIAQTTGGRYPIPQYVHDILSAFYFVRTVDFSSFKTGDMMTLYNFYGDKSYELGVRFLGRQDLEVAAGIIEDRDIAGQRTKVGPEGVGRGIRGPGRTVDLTTGAPARFFPPCVPRRVFVDDDERRMPEKVAGGQWCETGTSAQTPLHRHLCI